MKKVAVYVAPGAAPPVAAPDSSEAQALASELEADPGRAREARYQTPLAAAGLRAVLDDAARWSDRLHAVRALAEIGDRGSIGPVEEALLGDPDWAVRAEAADALGRLGAGREALVESSRSDKEQLVRLAADRALGSLLSR